jgi:hypothetical protein
MLDVILWIGIGVAAIGAIATVVGIYALLSRREREYVAHFRDARAHQVRVQERLKRGRNDS